MNNTTIPDSKRCRKCNQIKPRDAFYAKREAKDGLQSNCKDCNRTTSREWSAAHPEKHKEWYLANRETEIQKAVERHRSHPESARAAGRRHYHKHADVRKEVAKAWHAKYPERTRAINHKSNRKHHDKRRAALVRYRTQVIGNGGSYTVKEIQHIRFIQQGHCAYCGRLGQKVHIDHIIPVRLGGPSDIWNLCLACPRCNQSKGGRTLEQWTNRWYLRKNKRV